MPISETGEIIRTSPRLDFKDFLLWGRTRTTCNLAKSRRDVIWHLGRAAASRRAGEKIHAKYEISRAREARRLNEIADANVAALRDASARLYAATDGTAAILTDIQTRRAELASYLAEINQ